MHFIVAVMCFYGRIWTYYEPAVSLSSTTCCLRLFTSGVAPSTNFNLRWFSCFRKILSLTLRSYFYNIRNMLFSCWSFKIVLSIFDSARPPLVISHRCWNIFTFDVTSFDARMRSSAFGFDWNGQYFWVSG
jgi:hypothetical protein